MRLVLAVFAAFSANVVSAETWSARCQGMEFVFDRTSGKAILALATDTGRFPIAEGQIDFESGQALRAWLPSLGKVGDSPMMNVGLNRKLNVVYILRRDSASGKKTDVPYCETAVRVEP